MRDNITNITNIREYVYKVISDKLGSSSVLTESKIENILDTQGFELDAATGGQDRQWSGKPKGVKFCIFC